MAQLLNSQTSKLYDENRRLFYDKTYQIDQNTFNNLQMIEKVLLPKMYNGIKYSALAAENDFEGTIIVELSISAKAQDYQVEIVAEQISKTEVRKRKCNSRYHERDDDQ